MADIGDPVDIDEDAGQVEFLGVIDQHRRAAEHLITVIDGGEAVVDVAHVPVKVFHAAMGTEVLIVGVEHLPL